MRGGSDAKELLGDEADQYVKVPDTLDVWFDSGSTHSSVVDVRPEFAGHAADMYLEGSDQHRGWFMSSLMISTAMKGKAPYRQVLTHGLPWMVRAARCLNPSATPFRRRM